MHSTETALINVLDNLLKAIDEKSASLLVLLDMSKAFDSLNHNLLLEKLRKLALKESSKLQQFPGLAAIYLVNITAYDMKIQFQKYYL